jgi:hypothetical protein
MATATSGFVLLDQFVPEILQYVHGAPTILVRSAVKNTIIEFCKRTLCMKANPAPFYLDEDVHTYTLKYASDRYVTLDILDCRKGETDSNNRLEATTTKKVDSTQPNWRVTKGTPKAQFLTDDINKLRVYPIPSADSDEDYYVQAIVCPKKDQTEVPEFLYEKWEEIIQAGALHRLLSMKGASWFDRDLSRTFNQKYRRGLKNARKTTLTGIGQIPGQVTPRSYSIMGDSNATGRYNTWE